MPKIKTKNLEIYWEKKGDGPPLLAISGTGSDLRRKPNMLDGPIAKHFETLAYDQRGLGQTEKPNSPYTMADYAADADALMEAFDWPRAHVLGVSFGGMVAQELAIRYPERIDRLVLACTSPGGAGGSSFPFHDLEGMDPLARAKYLIPVSDTRRDAAWAAANPEQYQQLIDMALDDPFADEPGHAMGALRQLEARKHHDTWDRLSHIKAPTLVCGGRFDGIARPQSLENLAARIPDARLQFFDGGHLFMLQDRTAFPAMIAFLQEGA